MKKIDEITLMHYAEGVLKDKELKKIIKPNKKYYKKVESYKKTFKALKEFGKLLEKKDRRTVKEKINIKYTKLREYFKKKGVRETG